VGKPSKQASNVLYIAPKSTNESRAHYTPEPTHGKKSTYNFLHNPTYRQTKNKPVKTVPPPKLEYMHLDEDKNLTVNYPLNISHSLLIGLTSLNQWTNTNIIY